MRRARTARASLAIDWAAALAYGLGALLVGVLASTDGGYFPESWAWLSALTLFPALIVLLASDRVRLSRSETAFLAVLLAFGCWVMLSATWSVSVTSTVFEAERVLAYFGTTLLLLLVVTRRTAPFLLAGSLAGTAVVATYALLTRVLPDRFAGFDSAAGYRLSDPLGYWNGLGIFCAMGTLMALGLAARARSPLARAFYSALPVVLVSTLYFTFSRGAWIALAFGLAVTIAVDPRRLRLVLTGIALAPWSILAVWLASSSDALTVIGAPLSVAASEGHALLRAIVLLTVVSGTAGLILAYADRRVSTSERVERIFGGAMLALAGVAVVLIWAQWGSPYTVAARAWSQFRAPPKETSADLNSRLFDLSSNGRLQHWAVARDEFEAEPVVGAGAGSFAYAWAQRRPSSVTVQDAHSLYVETLGELGVVGLTLLATFLLVPLVAAAGARRSAVFPGALGAYGAYVLHAAVDWDWELTGVTLVALISAISLLAAARPEPDEGGSRFPALAAVPVALVLSVLAFASVLANVPLGRSREALDASRWAEAAAEARSAKRWAPWSSEPLRLLGEAQLATGNRTRARQSFRSALDKDPANWQLWINLALASSGAEQRSALERARQLNPLSGQVRQLLAPP